MQVLTRVYSSSELQRVVALMRSKGIPTYAEPAYRVRGGASQWVVFTCINSQARDAERVLANPEYMPAEPVDVEEFDRQASSPSGLATMLRWGTATLAGVSILFFLALWLVQR